MIYKSVTPILYSSDVVRSISYYVDVLGFESSWKWDEPATFGAVIKDNVEIFFCKDGQGNPGSWLSLFVDDVDEFYEKAKSRGAKIICVPQNMEWGIREMLVEDPDGHRIRFGQNALQSDKEITASRLPDTIRLVGRIPMPAELLSTVVSIGWLHYQDVKEEKPSPAVVHAVVAENKENGDVVGSVSLLSDAPGFYYVKNLMVHKDWQRKRIGSALMQELLKWLENNAPDNASVYLHTGENLGPFYKQFGFGPAFGMFRQIRRKM